VFKKWKKALTLTAVSFVLALCLFGQSSVVGKAGILGAMVLGTKVLFLQSKTQWLTYGCFCGYIAIFAIAERWYSEYWLQRASNCFWIYLLVGMGTLAYLLGYPASTEPPGALTLVTGVVFGNAVAAWLRYQRMPSKEDYHHLFLLSILALLLLASMPGHISHIQAFTYHGQSRWSGPWNSPNIYGLLMATGTVLATGGVVSSLGCQITGNSNVVICKTDFKRWGMAFLCLAAASIMCCGLLHSYSRGAWLAMLCGAACLLWLNIQSPKPKVQSYWVSRLSKNWLPISVILTSMLVLSFWHSRQTEWPPVRRVLSIVNTVDFSWQNRLAAWKGALQMMAEHPGFGAGWNQPEAVYEHYYLLPKLTESAAIEMNDYLMLGATLGIPALFCFGMYLWLSLTGKAESKSPDLKSNPILSNSNPPSVTCRAGAIVLLVGFWFDVGLFKLPTATIFWILLELGNARNHEIHEPHKINPGSK